MKRSRVYTFTYQQVIRQVFQHIQHIQTHDDKYGAAIPCLAVNLNVLQYLIAF